MKKKHIYMLPERMCGSASVEVLAVTSCTKVIHALPEPKHLSFGVAIVRTLVLRANLGSSDFICWGVHFPKKPFRGYCFFEVPELETSKVWKMRAPSKNKLSQLEIRKKGKVGLIKS